MRSALETLGAGSLWEQIALLRSTDFDEAAPVVVHEEQLREELGRLLTDDSYWSGESRRVLEFSRRNMGEREQASFLERLAI